MLAEDAVVRACGIDGAVFSGEPDPETNFKLFGPVPAAPRGAHADKRAFALRLRPDQCFHTALETFAAGAGLGNARIYGGVGSTIGARFDDGGAVENFATEVFIKHGEIRRDPEGRHVAQIDAGLVDFTGALAEGRLARGANHILMTFELIVAAD